MKWLADEIREIWQLLVVLKDMFWHARTAQPRGFFPCFDNRE